MCGLCAAWGAEPRPVALVGSVALGKADRRFFEYYVTAELGVVSEDRGEFLEPAEFPKYSMVVWLRECPRKFTPDETAAAKAYVESGGHLLMTNGAIIGALDRPFKAAPWIGAATWGYAQKGWQAEVLRTGDPCLAGVAAAGTPWLSGYHALMKFEGVNVLGKSGEFSTLGYQPLGAGRFIFSTYGPYDCRDETTKAQVLRIYRNLVAQAGPLTESAQAATLLGAAAPGRQLVLWQRDWDGSVESRLIWRPCGPRPEELLATLDFASAREEIDTAFFCAQAAQDVGEVRVKCAPLTAAVARGDTQTCLPGALRVLVMGQAPEVPIAPPPPRLRPRGPFAAGTFLLDSRGAVDIGGQTGFPVGAVRAEDGLGPGQHARAGAGRVHQPPGVLDGRWRATGRVADPRRGGADPDAGPADRPVADLGRRHRGGSATGSRDGPATLRRRRDLLPRRAEDPAPEHRDDAPGRLASQGQPAARPDSAAAAGLHAPVGRLAGPVPRPRHHFLDAQGHSHRPVVGRRPHRPDVRHDRAL